MPPTADLRAALRLLRLPFGVYLMPVYWYALGFVPWQVVADSWHWTATPLRAAAVFGILHLLVYPASNGFNSLHDRDTGPIGGLAAPPPPPPVLGWLVLALDLTAMALAWWLDARCGLLLLAYIGVSRAYSAPPLRLKARPIMGTVAVAGFQGAVTYLAVQAGSGVPTQLLLSDYNLLAATGSSLLLLGSYPLTQIYQHDEDGARGDLTLSRLLGVAGTFRFAQVVSALGAAYVVGLGWLTDTDSFSTYRLWNTPLAGGLRWSIVFGLWMLPTAVYVERWRHQVAAGNGPTHLQAMRLNQLASLSVSAFFLLTLVVQALRQ